MSKYEKIRLATSRDIPFNKLLLSQSNVRRIKAGVSIEDLAEDIARRGLLQGLSVRPVLVEDGSETGMFEIPAGGRRFRALELLARQKRFARTALVPCVVREGGIAEEDSLAENVQRAPLHPLDQFRAFLALREKGQSEEEIAATFFVAVSVVKQRLKLAAVSPRLLDIYAEDGLTLDQLMAFTVSDDHERQEQVFDSLSHSYDKQPHAIRRMLTEHAVRASDKRAQFVRLDAYVEAGGAVTRDLFQSDDGGWLQDVALLDMMVDEGLREGGDVILAEGWKWIEVAPSFPYGHAYGLRQLRGVQLALNEDEEAARAALQAELDKLEADYSDADELPEEVDHRLAEIETALAQFDARPMVFDADEMARAGAFVSIDHNGMLRVDRGYVRPEDELPVIEDENGGDEELAGHSPESGIAATLSPPDEPDEDDGLRPLPDRLVAELTAHRTIALRHRLGEEVDIAFLAAVHALALRCFYHYALDSCLEIEMKCLGFGAQAPGLADTPSARALDDRHTDWANSLPKEPEHLWDELASWNETRTRALFAHCVSLSVNAVIEPYSRRPRAIAHADTLASTIGLDMAAAGWRPTANGFFGRVTKARILQAVREGCDEAQAVMIEHLKKGDMATQAEALLADSGWLPEPLRTARIATAHADPAYIPDDEQDYAVAAE
ncbi:MULTISPECIES: ParB/RepB/Spo0J family partition protein [unclassified Sphingopyxis]|uniref:ParB/RepB/Spo0J family partition protein n=1 Tax=unclassified Sphingopyxis TaxID=2614943 RepID=UPI0007301826|nr:MULTISPECIES: ParB/RepB/Spo0J family partition protein [unclassified Sphingopyxis]KTE24109.1 DNA-binding protein [Sphingopyxis sp. H057]KTE50407.1 DNA-binding protein [Sphingopyxis sp. H073]KTE52496.1 DNA-binding protein [Sphingopyxis sp. H071]KTE62989.1 DNA-binding protein [Sphingopyxis sp. H107]KTE64877.1 DNA-binding protein [Sphingopyxis sp. H100]